MLFDRIVLRNPKMAEEFLNMHLDSVVNNSDSETVLPNSEPAWKIDMTPFNKFSNIYSCHESFSTYKMLEAGNRDLIKHPVTETFIRLKWQKINSLFYLSLFLRISFAIIATVTTQMSFKKTSSNTKHLNEVQNAHIIWAVVALYIPLFVMLSLEICRKRISYFISSWIPFLFKGLLKTTKTIHVPLPRFRAILQLAILSLFIAFIVTKFIEPQSNYDSYPHISVWLIFLSWVEVVSQLGESPYFVTHIHILVHVMKEVLTFLLSIIFIVVGFGSASLILFPSVQNFSQAMYSTLTMIMGNFQLSQTEEFIPFKDNTTILPGTTELMFLLAFLILALCTFIILVGLAIGTVREILLQKDDLEISQMIINNFEIEDIFHFLSTLCSKFRCGRHCITKPIQLLKDDKNCVFYVSSMSSTNFNYKRHWINPSIGEKRSSNLLIYKNEDSPNCISSYCLTDYTIPSQVLENARPILGMIQKYNHYLYFIFI